MLKPTGHMPSGAKKGHYTEGLSPRHPDFDRIDLICAVASAVCRYQQFRAATKIVDRIRRGETREERSGGVWHTQGSGKSLTMVFVARMMRTSPDLQDFKIVLVNDRVDLEEQLSKTAKLIGGRVNVIESIDHVWDHLSTEASDINMVMVHKFQDRRTNLPETFAQALGIKEPLPSASTFGVVNPSPRILLMIDEAHRTQKGNESGTGLADNLFEAFPNAARIAFTGTPLITERHALATQRSRIHLAYDTNLSPGQCQLDHARRRKAVCGAIQAASGHRSNHSLPIRTFQRRPATTAHEAVPYRGEPAQPCSPVVPPHTACASKTPGSR